MHFESFWGIERGTWRTQVDWKTLRGKRILAILWTPVGWTYHLQNESEIGEHLPGDDRQGVNFLKHKRQFFQKCHRHPFHFLQQKRQLQFAVKIRERILKEACFRKLTLMVDYSHSIMIHKHDLGKKLHQQRLSFYFKKQFLFKASDWSSFIN